VYVRLWSLINAIWQFNDYTYTASGSGAGCGSPVAATLTSPTNGSVLPATTVTFVWNAGTCAASYTLSVGKTSGGTDFYGPTTGTATSATVNNLPSDGVTTVFVRLVTTFSGGGTLTNDYSFTAFSTATGCGSSALATMSSPTPGSTLPGASVMFSWSAGCNITQYWLYVGSSGAGSSDIYNQSQGNSMTATVSLPTSGAQLFVRLWSFVNTASSSLSTGWHFIDYIYTAAGSGGGGCTTPAAATISSPTPGTTLAGASAVFTWNLGSCVSSVTILVGSSVGASDIFQAVEGLSATATVNNLPTNGSTVNVRLTSTFSTGGSQNVDYTYTASTGGGSGACGSVASAATMLTPAPGTSLPSQATFTWTAGCNATQYYLYVGSTPGGTDIYNASQGTNKSVTVNIQATSGQKVYVRLWSFLSTAAADLATGWHFNDYTYIAP
jgi:hypothetical protein